ncbi:hypothetical protein ABWL48_11835, partial [Streptococcus suis]
VYDTQSFFIWLELTSTTGNFYKIILNISIKISIPSNSLIYQYFTAPVFHFIYTKMIREIKQF